MKYGGVYRVGDVITFRRGSNEYRGRVKRRYDAHTALSVFVLDEDSGVRGTGLAYVRMRDVTAITEPVLTEKEREAIKELRMESRPVTVAQLNKIRDGASLPKISGTTMHGLSQRELVIGSRETATASGPMTWRLSEEGRRAAETL